MYITRTIMHMMAFLEALAHVCLPGPDTDLHDMGIEDGSISAAVQKNAICECCCGLLSLAKPHPLAVLACA